MQSIKIIYDRLVENYAIFITENGKQILWPKNKLPDNLQPGHILYLSLNNKPNQKNNNHKSQIQQPPKQNANQNKEQIAKAILEEILNSSDQENSK